MSRDRLRSAHAALAAAVERREETHRVAIRAGEAVRLHETEAANLAGADRQIALHHREQIRTGGSDPVPPPMVEAKRRADDAMTSLAGVRTARDELLVEHTDAVETEKVARDAVTDAAAAVLAEEAAAVAHELLEAKARAVTLEASLRALDGLWLPYGSRTRRPSAIRLPDTVGKALRAPASYADAPKVMFAPNPHSAEWQAYLRALQTDPDATGKDDR